MGLFWDLIQQSQIGEQKERAGSLEDRVAHLEGEQRRTREVLQLLLQRLEQAIGEDIDRDGRIG
jgi:chaperonin cofactor prefoldin